MKNSSLFKNYWKYKDLLFTLMTVIFTFSQASVLAITHYDSQQNEQVMPAANPKFTRMKESTIAKRQTQEGKINKRSEGQTIEDARRIDWLKKNRPPANLQHMNGKQFLDAISIWPPIDNQIILGDGRKIDMIGHRYANQMMPIWISEEFTLEEVQYYDSSKEKVKEIAFTIQQSIYREHDASSQSYLTDPEYGPLRSREYNVRLKFFKEGGNLIQFETVIERLTLANGTQVTRATKTEYDHHRRIKNRRIQTK